MHYVYFTEEFGYTHDSARYRLELLKKQATYLEFFRTRCGIGYCLIIMAVEQP